MRRTDRHRRVEPELPPRPAARRGNAGMSAFTVEIRVMPRASLLDPQGQAVQHALQALGVAEGASVRAGKHLVVQVQAGTREEAAAKARTMCDRLLANPVTEDYECSVSL